MKQGADFKGCHFFGYQPASEEFLHKPMDRSEKNEVRVKHKADVAAIRAHNFPATKYGYKTRSTATSAAEVIEKLCGVEMMVFNHDYM